MPTLKKSFALALFLAAAGVACVQPLRPLIVVGSSMAPTYASGSLLWTTPLDRPLRRGDVVVVDTPTGPIMKRVALLPGDRRYQWRGADGWTDMARLTVPRSRRGPRLRSVPVPAGMVYLLGDNLAVSCDSRSFGPVDEERVVRLVLAPRDPDDASGAERGTVRAWLALGMSRKGRKG